MAVVQYANGIEYIKGSLAKATKNKEGHKHGNQSGRTINADERAEGSAEWHQDHARLVLESRRRRLRRSTLIIVDVRCNQLRAPRSETESDG